MPLLDAGRGYGGEGCREVNGFDTIPNNFLVVSSAFARLSARREASGSERREEARNPGRL